MYAQKAVFLNPDRPGALNLLGGIAEVKGNRLEAEQYYRAALTRDPGYGPAKLNLERLAGRPHTSTRHCLGLSWQRKALSCVK